MSGSVRLFPPASQQVDDPTGYLHAAADKAVATLQSRLAGFDGQHSQEVAQVIVNVALIGLEARKVTDVPFSVGTNRRTQALIASVRQNPTGMLDCLLARLLAD